MPKQPLTLILLLIATSLWSQINFIEGSYVGTGDDSLQISGVGFSPDLIWLKPNSSSKPWIATSDMPTGYVKLSEGSSALQTGYLESIGTDGFTVSSGSNARGKTYHYVVFEASDNLVTGKYTGKVDATVNVGFEPDMIWLMGNSGQWYDYTGLKMGTNDSSGYDYRMDVGSETDIYELIGDITATGFIPGAYAQDSLVDYYYATFQATDGYGEQSTYGGNNTDGREITSGIEPQFVIVKRDEIDAPVFWTPSMGTESAKMSTGSLRSNFITGGTETGFTVGTSGSVNSVGVKYNYFSFKPEAATLLPVELTEFNAFFDNDYEEVTLTWKTASELNNSHFIIQKSPDGETFIDFMVISGHGTVDHESKYMFIDMNPYKNETYYRLKQVDFNGKSEEFKTIKVINEKPITQIEILGNPIRSNSFKFKGALSGEYSVKIFNERGMLEYEFNQFFEEGNPIHNVVFDDILSNGLHLVTFTKGKTYHCTRIFSIAPKK